MPITCFRACRDWHDMPTPVMTDELKRDLRLLRLRGAMDPKRFYKKAEKGRFPAKFALGTVVEGPTEWVSGGNPPSPSVLASQPRRHQLHLLERIPMEIARLRLLCSLALPIRTHHHWFLEGMADTASSLNS